MEKLIADHGFSERRAGKLIGVNRLAWQYEPLRGQNDAVRERIRDRERTPPVHSLQKQTQSPTVEPKQFYQVTALAEGREQRT